MTEKSTILLLENSLERHSRQDGSTVAILPWKKMNSLSASTGLSIRDLETAALENGILPERYERNHSTLTCEDQLRLLNSSVAIIGQGGLGGDRYRDSRQNRCG